MRAAHFREGEQESEGRFRALILVHPVDMQTIPAATALSIIERETEVVAAVKPFECLVGLCRANSDRQWLHEPRDKRKSWHGPRLAAGRTTLAPRRVSKSRWNRWAGNAHPERSDSREPAQSLETDIKKIGLIRPAACHDQSLRKARIVVSHDLLEPKPIRAGNRFVASRADVAPILREADWP